VSDSARAIGGHAARSDLGPAAGRPGGMTADRGAVPWRVGTRASLLATTQSGQVAHTLAGLMARPVELVRVRTHGDVLTGSLASMGGTGVFAVALRRALLDGTCDGAVHSLKDLPVAPVPGLTMIVPRREDPRDALCAPAGITLAGLPAGARVGTGSPRRAAQVLAARPDLELVDIRGNVDTRLARVLGPDPDLDAVILAYAGLVRLGRTEAASEILDLETMIPAAGQGALAVEVRTADLADPGLAAGLAAIDHTPTRLAVTAERAVLAGLDAGCAAPVGVHATVTGVTLTVSAVVASLDGRTKLMRAVSAELPDALAPLDPGRLADWATGPSEASAAALGYRLADELLAAGARDVAPLGQVASGHDR